MDSFYLNFIQSLNQTLCAREDLKLTVSVPQLAGLFRFAHNPTQSGFKSSGKMQKLPDKNLTVFTFVRARGLEHYMFGTGCR